MTTLSNQPSSLPNSLSELPSQQLWRSDAPTKVRKAWDSDPESAWGDWREHLTRNADAWLEALPSGCVQNATPAVALVEWGVEPRHVEPLAWLRRVKRALGSESGAAALGEDAAAWAAQSSERNADLALSLESLGWAYALPRLAASLPRSAWWSLTDALRKIAREAQTPAAAEGSDPAGAVTDQLLAGELGLVLGRLMPELAPLNDLSVTASEALDQGLLRLTDGEGLLAAPIVASTLRTPEAAGAASLLLACWTRCRALGAGKKRGPWSSDAEVQYEWLVRQLLRMADRQGRLPFGGAAENAAPLEAAVELAGDDADETAAARRLKTKRSESDSDAPEPSNHSEWSELGVLSAGWNDKAPRIVVAHPGSSTALDLRANRQTLLLGEWPIEATVDGHTLKTDDDWETQCWFSDEDCDYLELSLELEGPTGDMRLERLVMLSRQDGVAMIGDLLLADDVDAPADLSVTLTLPLAEGVVFESEKETREAILKAPGGKPAAGLIPLSLPEWRDDPRGGELTCVAGDLRLTRQARGRNLASLLWIDLAPSRFQKQRTWRQLAVAESLEKVDHDVAIGHRIQSGKDQWFVYRSLAEPANRTVLGQNLSSESLVGRFLATGEVDEYFEIEADD